MKKLINKRNLALLLPALGLFIFTAYQQILISTGVEVVLPIIGYDPRDFLSGHFMTYTIEFENVKPCQDYKKDDEQRYICLKPSFESFSYPENCTVFIKGKCRSGRFEAGIERFYVPETDASKLQKLLGERRAQILVSVSKDGTAKVKELLLNGKPWKEVELESSTNP